MVDDWLTRRCILTTKYAELEEVIAIAGLYIPGKMRMFTFAKTVENENRIALKYPMKILNTLSQTSAFLNELLRHSNEFIVVHLCNLNAGIRNVTGTWYIGDYMTNSMLFLKIGARMQKKVNLTMLKISCGLWDDWFRYWGPILSILRFTFATL